MAEDATRVIETENPRSRLPHGFINCPTAGCQSADLEGVFSELFGVAFAADVSAVVGGAAFADEPLEPFAPFARLDSGGGDAPFRP
jgi:hypothetical protein